MQREEQGLPSIFTDPLIQVLTGLLLFIALLYGERSLIYLALLILVMVNGAKLWGRLSLSGISCRLKADKLKVFPSEKISVKAEVVNSKFLPVWLRFGAPVKGLLAQDSVIDALTGESGLLWKQKVTWSWELTARRRGCHEIGPPYVAAGDLLGFFQRRKEFHPLQVIVFPRLIPLKEFFGSLRDFFGPKTAKSPVVDPVYPIATRDYHFGRPARYIHWKSSARHNRLQEKLFEPTSHGKFLLLVDVEQFALQQDEEGFERTLEAAASLAARLDAQGHAIGLICNGTLAGGGRAVVPVSRNPGQLSAILEALGRLELKLSEPARELLQAGLTLPWGTSLFYFTREIDSSIQDIRKIFQYMRMGVAFVTCQPQGMREIAGSKVFSLGQICSEEGARDG